jgi:hypothetical protein
VRDVLVGDGDDRPPPLAHLGKRRVEVVLDPAEQVLEVLQSGEAEGRPSEKAIPLGLSKPSATTAVLAGCGIVAVGEGADGWLRSRPLQVPVGGVREPDRAVACHHYVVRCVEGKSSPVLHNRFAVDRRCSVHAGPRAAS